MSDLEVTDTVPTALEILSAEGNPEIDGQRVIWRDRGLSDGETLTFHIMARVKSGTSNGHVLVNTVKARSEDEGISATDTDTTVVETAGAVAAARTPAGPQPVPITAKTGAGILGWLVSLIILPLASLAALIS